MQTGAVQVGQDSTGLLMQRMHELLLASRSDSIRWRRGAQPCLAISSSAELLSHDISVTEGGLLRFAACSGRR